MPKNLTSKSMRKTMILKILEKCSMRTWMKSKKMKKTLILVMKWVSCNSFRKNSRKILVRLKKKVQSRWCRIPRVLMLGLMRIWMILIKMKKEVCLVKSRIYLVNRIIWVRISRISLCFWKKTICWNKRTKILKIF